MMAMSGTPATAEHLFRCWKRVSMLSLLPPLAFLAACSSSSQTPPPDPPEPPPPARVMPAGRLAQAVDKGPLTHVTESGWRTRIENGAVTIQPPEGETEPGIQYIAWRMRDQLGTHDLRAWSGERRSLLLPGGAKITMHGQAGEIMRLSLYDGAESHEVDVLTQTLMHSRVDAGVAQTRDAAEADGETGHLRDFEHSNTGPGSPPARLHLANLYMQAADATGAPLRREADVRVLGRLSHTDLEVNPLGEEPAVQADEACTPTTEPRGNLVRLGDGTLQYTTRSGLWTVRVNLHTITLTRSGKFKWEVWGDPHENLNGKHIKDWEGNRRTLLLDDGVKITMDAYGPQQVVHTTSIYDGTQSHEVGNLGNAVRHSCVNAEVAAIRDGEEADGETAHLANLRGPAVSIGYLYVEHVYNEAVGAEVPEEAEFEPATLGETGDAELNPNQVRDYYDDPRLGHT